jgi:hypothetical protein
LTRRAIILAGAAVIVILTGAGIAAATRDAEPVVQTRAGSAPIYELARVSAIDAEKLDAHAAAMERIAAAEPAHAQWAQDAASMRNNAGTLRFIARSSLAIAGDRGANPDTSVEVRRVLGDGLNLDALGTTVIEQAASLEAHLESMRAEAGGDPALIALIDASAPDVVSMRRDGEAAVKRGRELQKLATGIAQTTGQALPGP